MVAIVAGIELVADVFFPQRGQIEVGADLALECGDAAFMGHQRGRLVEV